MLTEVSRAHYAAQVAELVRTSALLARPARGAWLKQQFLRREPQFSERKYGFDSFRSFLEALDSFIVDHDGRDIVVMGPQQGASPPVKQAHGAPVRSLAGSERSRTFVTPEVWRAAIRDAVGPAAYINAKELQGGHITVVYADAVDGSDEYAGRPKEFIEIPRQDPGLLLQLVRTWVRSSIQEGALATEMERVVNYQQAVDLLNARGLGARWSATRRQTVLKHLRDWAARVGLQWAPPLLADGRASTPTQGVESGVAELRAVCLRAVAMMTERELRDVRVPLGLVYDELRRSQGGSE